MSERQASGGSVDQQIKAVSLSSFSLFALLSVFLGMYVSTDVITVVASSSYNQI